VRHDSVLLASHGTPGARAAEALALSLCAPGGTLHHLLVVPDLWKGMMGDDWLNNARTRIRFGDYLEAQLGREVEEQLQRVEREAAARGVVHHAEVRQGKPADCLVAFAAQVACGLVVIGAPRPKGEPGLRSRLDLETAVRGLRSPLLIAPHPHA
jgi:nucleotide-binding universal stress UspA family protein